MSRKLLLAAVLSASGAFALPASGAAPVDNSAALAALDASLPGELINDPTSLDWTTQSENLRTSNISDPAIPGGGAASHFNVRKAGPNPWAVQVYVPLTANIGKGDAVTVGFWARTTVPPAGAKEGQIRLRVQDNVDPWPGFGDTGIAVGPEWAWHEMTATATIDVPKRNGMLVFQIGAEKQEIEIGQTIVVKGASKIIGDGARPAPPLPPQLAGKGVLLSQPDSRDWVFVGPDASRAAREDKTIWLNRAVQFTSPGVGANAWDIQADVPLTGDIKAGDKLLIAVAAKTVSAATDDGKAVIGVRVQQNSAPFSGFADNRIKVGSNWQLVQIQTTATMDMAAGSAMVALHFSGAQQVVDIGPAYVLKLPPAQ